MGWRDTIQNAPTKKSWRDTIQDGPNQDVKEPAMAASTGLIQGALPFVAGPIAGAGKAFMDGITGTKGPLAGGSMSDLADDYSQTKNQFESDAAGAKQANPLTSMGASAVPLAGGVLAGAASLGAKLPSLSDAVKMAIMAKTAPLSLAKKVGGAGMDAVADAISKRMAAQQALGGATEEAAPLVQQAIQSAAKFDPFTKKFIQP